MSKAIFLTYFFTSALAANADAALSPDSVRERIATVTLKQAEKISADWDPGQRDCAGFVRFAYRTATESKQPLWRDRKGEPALFLTADELVAWNFERITRDVNSSLLKTGDLLVFYQSDKPADDAWHLMIALEPPARAPNRKLLVYHNGERGRKGHVRKVWLDDLIYTAEKNWRPVISNTTFMGVYRWRGWRSLDATEKSN